MPKLCPPSPIQGSTASASPQSLAWEPVAEFPKLHERTIFSIDWSPPISHKEQQEIAEDQRVSSLLATGGADDSIQILAALEVPKVQQPTDVNDEQPPTAETGVTAMKFRRLATVQKAHDGDVNCVKYVITPSSLVPHSLSPN